MILKEKRLKEIRSKVQEYIGSGIIKTKIPKEHVDFFLRNAEDSLNSALCLYDVSINKKYGEYVGYPNLQGYLWVINAAYYSMFYMARALLEHEGVKIKSDLSVHSLTFDALVYFFYMTGKLKKKLLEFYTQAQEEAAELLGQQKADELVAGYFFEKGKRATFTYETGSYAIQSKAKTSIDRAVKFNKEMRRIIHGN